MCLMTSASPKMVDLQKFLENTIADCEASTNEIATLVDVPLLTVADEKIAVTHITKVISALELLCNRIKRDYDSLDHLGQSLKKI